MRGNRRADVVLGQGGDELVPQVGQRRIVGVGRRDPVAQSTGQADGDLGRVIYTVPWVGHVAALSHTPLGLLIFLAVPLLLLGIDELVRIWRPAERAA